MGTFDELDEDKFDCDNFVVIPHKNDLDLGQRLVFDFAEQRLQDELDRVQHIFSYRSLPKGSRTSWTTMDFCRACMILRTREKKRHCGGGLGRTRSS